MSRSNFEDYLSRAVYYYEVARMLPLENDEKSKKLAPAVSLYMRELGDKWYKLAQEWEPKE